MTYLAAVGASLGFILLTILIAETRFGMGGACLFSASCVVLFIAMSLPMVLQALLTCIACMFCLAIDAKPRTVLVFFTGAAVASYGFVFWKALPSQRELERLRESYPFVSMAGRLSYEPTRRTSESTANRVGQELPLSENVAGRLSDFESNYATYSDDRRTEMLRMLHDRARNEFASALGFGNMRMRIARRKYIELPESASIPLPDPPDIDSPYDPENPGNRVRDDGVFAEVEQSSEHQPSQDDMESMHVSALGKFLDPGRMGYIKDRDHVAGFQSHQFLKAPRLGSKTEEAVTWQVTRLELVSLLKHDTPSVYASRNLPRMDELVDAQTRPLDDFEMHALDRLRHEKALIIDDALNRIRMVGSVRAGRQCLECHEVQRGELLGAFSYELHRVEPIPAETRQIAPSGPRI